jgi:hypothetical protein
MANEETNGMVQSPTSTVDTSNWPRVDQNFARNHPEEVVERYRGNWVAWSTDGRSVLVADPDPYKLCEKIDAAGLKPGDYVLSGIPQKNVVFLGGMFGFEAEWGP